MNKLRTRHWALSSHGALLGKTTFIASNCRTPIIVVDTDGRFDAVEALIDGEVFYPSQVINPLTLAEEIMELCATNKIGSIAFDSLTKLYSIHARMAYMRNQQGRGSSKSRAAEMVHKSNAMTIARDMAMLGTDMYYTWHTTSGVDSGGQSEIRSMISDIERERLQTSINVTLEFIEDSGCYGARIQNARDFGGRKANIGFTIWDAPGNYWRGAADWIEELIYTSFTGKPEAVAWVARELSLEIDEAEGVYDYVKESHAPETPALMWVALIMRVRELQQGDTAGAQGDTGDTGDTMGDTINPKGYEDGKGDTGAVGDDTNIPPQEYAPENTPADDAQMDDTVREEAEKNASSGGDTGVAGGDTGDQSDTIIWRASFGQPTQNHDDSEKSLPLRMREHLADIATKRGDSTVLLGQVVYAILEAVPDRFPDAGGVLDAIAEYPDLPEGYTFELDKVVTLGGGQKFFDFAVRP